MADAAIGGVCAAGTGNRRGPGAARLSGAGLPVAVPGGGRDVVEGQGVAAPHVVAGVTNPEGSQVAIGFVTGDVSKVSLSITGESFSATVVPVAGAASLGAYTFGIPGSYGSATGIDFTGLVGYDSRGDVIVGAGS